MKFPKRKSSIIMITPYAKYRSLDSKKILTHQRNRKASDASCFFMCCRLLLCSCAVQLCMWAITKLAPRVKFLNLISCAWKAVYRWRIHAEHLLSYNLVHRPQDYRIFTVSLLPSWRRVLLSDGREYCDTAVFFIFQNQLELPVIQTSWKSP